MKPTAVTVTQDQVDTAIVTTGEAGSGKGTITPGAIAHVTVTATPLSNLSNNDVINVTLTPDSGFTLAAGFPTTKTVKGLSLKTLAAPKVTAVPGTATGDTKITWNTVTGVTTAATFKGAAYTSGTNIAGAVGDTVVLTNTVSAPANHTVTKTVTYKLVAADIKS